MREGYSNEDLRDSDRQRTIDAPWGGRFYSESRHYPTYARFAITSLTEQEAVVEVSARLVHPEIGEYILLPNPILNIRGDDLAALTEHT